MTLLFPQQLFRLSDQIAKNKTGIFGKLVSIPFKRIPAKSTSQISDLRAYNFAFPYLLFGSFTSNPIFFLCPSGALMSSWMAVKIT